MIDVLVIGGGHAGCEAAHAASKIGVKTMLITSHISSIGHTPCNPSIGGPAKGIVVREIDALGGIMGIIADKSSLQTKILNRSKGPAVHSIRSQVDKIMYPQNMQDFLLNLDGLEIKEATVDELIIEDGQILGVKLDNEEEVLAKKVILTTGTYMDSFIINGDIKISSGPDNYKTTKDLSASLKANNVELFKLKTGTPARVKTDSIDFSKGELTPGDDEHIAFSFYETKEEREQIDCYLIHTNKTTHDIINKNLSKSAMYSGVIEGVGPRYCPSIEDKLVRFADKERHQLFLEPESLSLDTTYVQGFSTSMPYDIQDEMIKSLPGFENAVIDKYGYAIEYDALRPEQLKRTLELKDINNLYSAGQINGTSGYEEAAGQGIVAGINAALSCLGRDEFTLSRGDSYIGLMIDDLVTKGTDEPYRLLTSRSEYRLYLRSDNADLRLSQLGHDVGLLRDDHYQKFVTKRDQITECIEKIDAFMVTPKILTEELALEFDTQPLRHGLKARDFLKRTNINHTHLARLMELDYPKDVLIQVEIQIKYEGYIKKLENQIERNLKLYNIKIPTHLDYKKMDNIALEAREKLDKMRPETLGHATQISGINPSDIAVLQIYIETDRRS